MVYGNRSDFLLSFLDLSIAALAVVSVVAPPDPRSHGSPPAFRGCSLRRRSRWCTPAGWPPMAVATDGLSPAFDRLAVGHEHPVGVERS